MGRIACIALLVAAALQAAHATQQTTEAIFCGTPLSRQLMSGGVNTFRTSLLPGTVVSVDSIDVVEGFPKMQFVNFTPATETCRGEQLLTTSTNPGIINVTDCFSTNPHDYTITLSVVSQGQDNCAVALPCGTPLNAAFTLAGEVDSYAFPGTEGDEVSLAVTNISPAIGQVRIRLFDPSGVSIYDGVEASPTCPASVRIRLPRSGSYTALLSSCTGAKTGQYTVTWQPPSCASTPPSGQFAYVANADSGTMTVVDLSTNVALLSTPITPAGRVESAAATYVTITPNGGFAWAIYETSSNASVVNTSTNVLVASVPSGLEANGISTSPDNTLAYILSNSLEAIVVVDTSTNKVTTVAPLDTGFSQGLETAVTPDGTFLYLISDDDQTLTKINTTDYTKEGFTDLIDLGLYDAFAVTPDGTAVYAGLLDGIAVVDTTTNMVIHEIPIGAEPFGIAFTGDGRTAYATIIDNGTVAVIDTASPPHVVDTIPVTDSPAAIAIAPDTGLAYVTELAAAANEPGIFVIDTKTNKVIGSIVSLGDGPASIALTTAPTGLCVGFKGQTEVTVDEIVRSVNYALDGCPGRFPPMSMLVP